MLNSNSQAGASDSALGIAIFDCASDVVKRVDGFSTLRQRGSDNTIPPALVLGELSGEKPTVDISAPPSIRGTGLAWPASARVNASGSARFPLALAWPFLEYEAQRSWTWYPGSGRSRHAEPADAIAEVVCTSLGSYMPGNSSGTTTLVVPNTLSIEGQDDLLRALSIRGVSAHLLWRPIAAAMVWVEKYGPELRESDSPANKPIGLIWVMHLGVDAFELTQLALIPKLVKNNTYVLPARRLPSLPTLYGEGLGWAEHRAACATAVCEDDGSAAWNLLWTTSWLSDLVRRLNHSEMPGQQAQARFPLHCDDVLEHGVAEWRSLTANTQHTSFPRNLHQGDSQSRSSLRSSFASLNGPYSQPELARNAEEVALLGWLNQVKQKSVPGLPILGLVATGAFASAAIDDHTLAEFILTKIAGNAPPRKTLIEAHNLESRQLLATGAAIYGERRARQLPTYLDMLPQLQSLIIRSGEPTWANLLGAQDHYVAGGEELVTQAEDLGLRIRQEETDLTLSVWQEGHRNVREVNVAFPCPVPHETPVSLELRMVPGQGNPRVEVKPSDSLVFGGRRVYLDWRRAHDSGFTKEEAADQIPRTNPPLEPRVASVIAWRGGSWGYGYDWSGCVGAVRRLLSKLDEAATPQG